MNTILTRNYDTLLAEVKAHIAADAARAAAFSARAAAHAALRQNLIAALNAA
jgi:hypothetical protein